MRIAPLARRSLALVAATAMLTSGGVATGLLAGTALAATPTTGTVTPNSAINRYADASTTSTTLTIQIPGAAFPRTNAVTVTVFRMADTNDTLMPTGAPTVAQPASTSDRATTADTVSQPVALSVNGIGVNPGSYGVHVNANDAGSTLLGSCDDCFTVLAYAPECTSYSGGVINGQNFPKTTYLRFLKPGETDVSAASKDDLGLVATPQGPPLSPAPSDTSITFGLDPKNALGGSHLVVVRNTAGQYVQCAGTFTVPRGHLFADAVPNRPVPTVGRNSTKVPFTVVGDAPGNPGLTNDVAVKVGVFPGLHNGVTTSVTSVDGSGLHVAISADKTADTGGLAGGRGVTYVAPDGGFFSDPKGLNVSLNPGVDNSTSTSPSGQTGTKPTPATIGQGATDIPVVINVPYDSSGSPVNLYDGSGLTASLGNVPGLSVKFDKFKDAADADGYHQQAQILVSTIGKNADGSVVRPAAGTYTLGEQNADGGVSSPGPANNNKDDGSCAGCFTVATGPIVAGVTPANVSPGSNVSLSISGTGFVPSTLTGPAHSTVTLPPVFTNQSVTVNNANSITVTATVSAAASSQAVNVTVTNPGNQGTDTCVGCVTINGTSVGTPTPSSALNQGTATLTIPGGPFESGSAVQLERAGYPSIVGSVDPVLSTPTAIHASFPLDLAAPGSWSVHVTGPTGATGYCQNCFSILGSQPSFTSESPSGAHPGARVDLQIVGDFFARGTTLNFFNTLTQDTQGITVLPGAFVTDRKHLTVPLMVTPSATSGPKTFTIVNADGQKLPPTQIPTFTVLATPGASQVSPATRAIGSPGFTMTITGTNLSNVQSVQITGSGLTTGTPTTAAPTANSTSVTVPVSLAPGETSTAARDVILTNDDGSTAKCANCFALIAAPTVTAISPKALSPGDSNKQVTVTGTGFGSSPSLDLGSGVTIGTIVPNGDTSFTAAVTVAGSAVRGVRDVVVTNTAATSGGKGTLSKGFAVSALPAAPTSLVAKSDDKVVHLTWVETDDGGSPITKYTVTTKSGPTPGTTTDVTGPAADIGGLTNGTTYTFTVTATNALGTSPSSAPVDATPTSVPGAPQSVTAQAGDASATLTWTAPASNGGSAITSYTVTSSPAGGTVTYPTNRAQTGATVSGLINGTAYTFSVAATNAAGTGPAAASNPVTPTASLPTAPSGLTASVTRAAGTADLTWNAPSAPASPVTSYTVSVSPNNGTVTYPATRTSTGAVVTGLTNGTLYSFTVVANEVTSTSPPSNVANARPYDVPGVVKNLAGSTNGSNGSVTWTAPTTDGGSPITKYTMTVTPSAGTTVVYPADRTQTGATITGLSAGTNYSVSVVAENLRGAGAPSTFGPLPAAVVPSAPRTPSATAGNAQATVSWTAPSSDGGSAVTGYTVTSNPGGITKTVGNVLTATVTGLTNGTAYTFTVVATNAKGSGPASVPTNSVTPVQGAGSPSAPTSVVAKAGNASATVTFNAPTNSGGSAISSYTVTPSPAGGTVSYPTDRTQTGATVTGLTNGVSYTFSVKATNAQGSGPAAVSNAVTPSAVTPSTVVGLNGATGTIRYGTALALTGRVVRGDQSVPIGVISVLMRTDDGVTRTLFRLRPSSTGDYIARYLPSFNGSYTVRYDGDGSNPVASSAARRILVAVRIQLSASSGAATTPLLVSGVVGPNKAGRSIALYRVTSSGLQTLALVRIASDSTYHFSVRLARGSYTLQVGMGATPGNAAGASRFAVTRS